MATWLYAELGHDEPLEITEEEILETYYPWWSNKLRTMGRDHLISKEGCIDDWVVVNWAWRKETT